MGVNSFVNTDWQSVASCSEKYIEEDTFLFCIFLPGTSDIHLFHGPNTDVQSRLETLGSHNHVCITCPSANLLPVGELQESLVIRVLQKMGKQQIGEHRHEWDEHVCFLWRRNDLNGSGFGGRPHFLKYTFGPLPECTRCQKILGQKFTLKKY